MKSVDIQIEKWGRILAGQNTGSYVFVKNDSVDTGGFFIYQGKEPSLDKAFDNWAKDFEDVKKYFHFAGWEIEWLET